jgi:hypothetical protein
VIILVEATTPHTVLANSSFPFAINCCTFAFIAFLADMLSWLVHLFVLVPGTSMPSRTRLLREVTIKTTAFWDAELCSRVDRHSHFGGEKNLLPSYVECRTYNSSVPHIQHIRAAHKLTRAAHYNSSEPHIQFIRDAHTTRPSRTQNSSVQHIQLIRTAHKLIAAAHKINPCST